MDSTKDGEIAGVRKDEGAGKQESSFRWADLPAFKKPKLHLQEGVPSTALNQDSSKKDILDTCLSYVQRTVDAHGDPMKLEAFLPSFLSFLDNFELDYCKKQLGPMPTGVIYKIAEFLEERSEKLDLLSLNKEILAESRREMVPWPSGIFKPRAPEHTSHHKYQFSHSSPYMLAGETSYYRMDDESECSDVVLRLYSARRGVVHTAVIQNAGCCSISPTCEQVAVATENGPSLLRLYRMNDLASESISLEDYSELEIPGVPDTSARSISDVEFSETGHVLCVRTELWQQEKHEHSYYTSIFDPTTMHHLQTVQVATSSASICTSDCLLWQDSSGSHLLTQTFVQSIFDTKNSKSPTHLHDVFGNIKIHGFAQHALSPSLVAFVGEEIVPTHAPQLSSLFEGGTQMTLGVAKITIPDAQDKNKSISCEILAEKTTSFSSDRFYGLEWIPCGNHIVVRQERQISVFTFDESSPKIADSRRALYMVFDQISSLLEDERDGSIDGFAADHNCNTLLFRYTTRRGYTLPTDDDRSPLVREHLFTP